MPKSKDFAMGLRTILFIFFICLLSAISAISILNLAMGWDISGAIFYDKQSKIHSQEEYSLIIAELCNLADSSNEKVHCVNNFFKNVFDYEHQDHFNSVEYTLENSGDCKNSVLAYCSIFRNMNLSCKPMFLDEHKHAYAMVEFEEGYCSLDQKSIDCHTLS